MTTLALQKPIQISVFRHQKEITIEALRTALENPLFDDPNNITNAELAQWYQESCALRELLNQLERS